MKFVAGVVLACFAFSAGAATLVGGGSTLPALGYTRSASGGPIGTGSLFGVYMANHSGTSVTYCPTGSGTGKKIFAGNDPTNFQVNGACGATFPAVSGFGGTGLTQAHFAASEAPLLVSEYNAYVVGHGLNAQPMQLPSIAGAIAIIFKKSGVNSLTLTENQICGIFSGQITDWNQIVITAAGPINIVFDRSSSGTSFSFLNHLSTVCPGTASGAIDFGTLQSYTLGAASYIPLYASQLPAGGANGDAGVVAAVAGSAPDGSIGYAEAANAVAGGVRVASVTNLAGRTVNPLTGFGPTVVPVTLTFDKVISDTLDHGRPVLVDLPLTNGLPTSSNGCIALVDPSSYANPAPAGSNSANYPILATTNLLGNKQGNGTDVAAVRSLLGASYDTTIRASVTTIGRINTGYAWLSSADLTQARVNSCIN